MVAGLGQPCCFEEKDNWSDASKPPHSQARMMHLRERVKPGVSRRQDFNLVSRKAALLIIDVQQYCKPPAEPPTLLSTTGEEADETEAERQERLYYSQQAHPTMLQNIQKLAAAFRVIRDDDQAMADPQFQQKSTGCEVVFTE